MRRFSLRSAAISHNRDRNQNRNLDRFGQSGALGQPAGRWIALTALLLLASGAGAQTMFAPQNVGTTSAAKSITVKATSIGQVASVQVLTLGTQGLDFQSAAKSPCSTANFAAVGDTCTQSVDFSPTTPGVRAGAVVLLDSSSSVLGTAYLSGTGLAGLGVLSAPNMITYAGVYRSYSSTTDGIPADLANLHEPTSLAFDGAGNSYIADSLHERIRKVTAATGLISTVVGNGAATYTGDNGLATNATVNDPQGVAVDGAGNLYIADSGNNVIRKVIAATGIITTFAGTGAGGYNKDNIQATAAELNDPLGVTVAADGNVYIADTGNQRIRKVNVTTGVITTVAGNGFIGPDGFGAYSGDKGPATKAELNEPYAVVFDAAGDMYIPDSANNRIRKVDTAGVITTYAGTGVAGFYGVGVPADTAELHLPQGVAVDAGGNLYISDTQNSAIRKVSAAAPNNITTVVQNGLGVTLLPGATTPITVTMYAPSGLAIDAFGNVYFADYLYMMIREIEANVAILDYRATPVRQGDVSAPQAQIVENDGTADLDLTSITHDKNAAIDGALTTCNTGSPKLAVDEQCVISAEFAPSAAANPLIGNIKANSATVNSPLDIELVGDATAVNSTTVTLISTPNPSYFTQSVTFTATVSSGASTGTPTGTVVFKDGAKALGAPVGLNGAGVAVYVTSALGVGKHQITAVYSGDKAHLASTSSTLVQEVDEKTVMLLSSSLNPAPVGAAVTFTMTVSPPDGGCCIPAGTVTLSDGAKVLGNFTLKPVASSGQASFTTSALAAGVHPLTATFSGEASKFVLSSTSAVLDEDIQGSSKTTIKSSLNPSVFGESVTFTATVTPSEKVAPTGFVEFVDGAKVIGAANLAGTTGVATFSISTLSVGTHSIVASYRGGTGNSPSVSDPINQVVTLGETSVSLAAIPNPGTAGKPVAITATVKLVKGSDTPTGSVTFKDGATVLGTVALSTAGTAAINPVLTPGTHPIVAEYLGDTNDGTSTSAVLDVKILLGAATVTVSANPNPAIVDSSIAFTAQVSGNGVTPTGNITFEADGKSIGTAALSTNGVAIVNFSGLAVGTHSITAHYGGDSDNSAATSSAVSEAVQAIPTVTALGASSGSGKQIILLATVVGTVGPTPTGTVTFKNGTTVIGSATLDAGGSATLTPNLNTGNYSIIASYGGDSIHLPSSSTAVVITGSPAGFNLTVTPPTLTLATKKNANLTVKLASNSGFTDTIGLGCGSLPAGVTCHFSNISVDLSKDGTQSVQLTIDTNNPLGGGSTASNTGKPASTTSLAGFFLPASAVFGFFFWRTRRRFASMFTIALVLALSGAATLVSGCGGFTQSSATPGKYVIQVTGVGQNSDIIHYQDVTLNITQ